MKTDTVENGLDLATVTKEFKAVQLRRQTVETALWGGDMPTSKVSASEELEQAERAHGELTAQLALSATRVIQARERVALLSEEERSLDTQERALRREYEILRSNLKN